MILCTTRLQTCGKPLHDSGEIGELANWWEWFEDNKALFRSIERRTAERYMQVAGDPDPAAKAEELRNKNTEQRRSRKNLPKEGEFDGHVA